MNYYLMEIKKRNLHYLINASFQVPVRAEPGVHPAGHHPPRHGTLHESRARVQRAPAQPVLQNWSVEYTVHTVNIQCILLSGHVGH